ncbi:DUF3515 domain-containing protein [Arthrobacter cryoconiti]|uniref:DUF3515 domain-containing protein n=1 Tax=Arthrobacter cryoconiti TaxID=748907 RepID=A0ABV8R5S1_9MICC|nr:DUF3515 domain-containing protein [Arthrobacter cryoconiti]MCC9069373.1 DUF3515 domain-containing protein [Arthrobacter cryoconiti]
MSAPRVEELRRGQQQGDRRSGITLPSIAILALLAVAVSGCTAAVDIKAAPDASNPGCATILSHLPDTIAGLSRRETTGISTAAWGSPSGVVLRCGVAVPGPTTLPCGTVNGVDWIVQESGTTRTLTSYGRTPATEVILTVDDSHAGAVPAALGSAISLLPATRRCVGHADVLALPTD